MKRISILILLLFSLIGAAQIPRTVEVKGKLRINYENDTALFYHSGDTLVINNKGGNIKLGGNTYANMPDLDINIKAEEVIVAKSGGEYTSLKQAVDSILDASASKPYIIRVSPGEYYEQPFTIPPYVTIQGSSQWFNTHLISIDSTLNFITGSGYSSISDLTISGSNKTGKAAIYYNENSYNPFIVNNVLIHKGYYGIHCSKGAMHIFNAANWYDGTNKITQFIRVDGGTIIASGCSISCESVNSIDKGYVCEGSSSYIDLTNCTFSSSGGSTDGAYVNSGGVMRLNSCVFAKGYNAIHVGVTGHSILRAADVTIRNTSGKMFTNKDILVDGTGASVMFYGISTSNKISTVNQDSLFAVYLDLDDEEPGFSVRGELNLWTDSAYIPVKEYLLTTGFTGYVSGGRHSRLSGLTVSITQGEGYINSSKGIKEIFFPEDTLLLPANSLLYSFIDFEGTWHCETNEPDKTENILLGIIRTNGTDVISLLRYKVDITHSITKTYDYLTTVIGPVNIDGNVTSEYNTESKQLDVSGGSYYIATDLHNTTPHSQIMFTYWYRAAVSGNWEYVKHQTSCDTAKWDNATGTLANMGIGKYRKDALYLNYHNDTTEYHILYGQELFTSVAEAIAGNMPSPPIDLGEYSLLSAGIVMSADSNHIVSVVDYRPVLGQKAAQITPTLNHNSLLGLNLGDYKHLTAAEYTGNGTGSFVRTTSPTLITPNIGAATATTLKVGSANGIAKLTTGNVGTATAGIDYENPLSFSAPIERNVNTISMRYADGSNDGYLTKGNWTTFNNKQSVSDTLTFDATVTSVKTRIADSLNVNRLWVKNRIHDSIVITKSWTLNRIHDSIVAHPQVYPTSGIALSNGTGWGTSITNNSANWNTAYGWGNWATGLSNLTNNRQVYLADSTILLRGYTTKTQFNTGQLLKLNLADSVNYSKGYQTKYGNRFQDATSSIQTQLNTKAPINNTTLTGTTTINALKLNNPQAVSSVSADSVIVKAADGTIKIRPNIGAYYMATPANPTGTNSTVGVMMGLKGSITPLKSGLVMITITGTAGNSNTNRSAIIQMRFGTGTAPNNSAALTGTTLGNTKTITMATTAERNGWACPGVVLLTVGTTYWIDISLAADNNTATVYSIGIAAIEQ